MKGILIFIKNPILGKAKTRLARDIGKEKALEVYKLLLGHTRKVTQSISFKKLLYYAWRIADSDEWDSKKYAKHLQSQNPDLGVRMHSAFQENFDKGFDHLIIIGSDCYDLSEDILNDAFAKLNKHEAVIGPAIDGGYYLIGLSKKSSADVLDELFLNKDWSHENVAAEATKVFKANNVNYHTLPILSDIDTVEDLKGELLTVAGLK